MRVPRSEGVANHIGPESCVRYRRRRRPRSVDRGFARLGIEPRNDIPDADDVQRLEGNTELGAIASRASIRRGRRPRHGGTFLAREPGGLAVDRRHLPSARIGKAAAVADDERPREVRPAHSSGEAGEQRRATVDGAGGAKGRGRGECASAKHALDTEPGRRDRRTGAHTDSREAQVAEQALRRKPPEVGAVCGNSARTVLCGGRAAMRVPTAIPN